MKSRDFPQLCNSLPEVSTNYNEMGWDIFDGQPGLQLGCDVDALNLGLWFGLMGDITIVIGF